MPQTVRLPLDAITVTVPRDARGAPTTGVLGIAALPALPVSLALADRIVADESAIVPARPFGTTATTAIYHKAASKPDAGSRRWRWSCSLMTKEEAEDGRIFPCRRDTGQLLHA